VSPLPPNKAPVTPEELEEAAALGLPVQPLVGGGADVVMAADDLPLPPVDLGELPPEEELSPLQLMLEEEKKSDAARREMLLGELTERLKMKPGTVDWTPLASQLDSMFGTKTMAAAESRNQVGAKEEKRVTDLYDRLTARDTDKFGKALATSTERKARDVLSGEDKLRDDFMKSDLTKQFDKAKEGIDKVRALAASKSQGGANDVALIYAFMKAQDPGSVVKEGEFATAQKYSGSLYDMFGIKFDRIRGGSDMLTPEQRQSMIRAAETAFGSQEQSYSAFREQFADLARRRGYDPASVLVGHAHAARRVPTAPAAKAPSPAPRRTAPAPAPAPKKAATPAGQLSPTSQRLIDKYGKK